METSNDLNKTETELWRLEKQVGELIVLTEALKHENHALRSKQDQLLKERESLVEKHDYVQDKVEAMISRLKTYEDNQ